MRVLDVSGARDNRGFPLVFATMLFPNDLQARDDSLELARAEVRVAGLRTLAVEGIYSLSPMERLLLEDAEIFRRHSKADTRSPFLHGLMAGTVLGFVLGCTASPELKRHASVSAAIRALANTLPRGTGVENFRQHVWPNYRSVSHFWAAFGGFGFRGWDHGIAETTRLATRSVWTPQSVPKKTAEVTAYDAFRPRWEACQARSEEFLALSEILRRRGESWTPHKAQKSVLDEEESWRLPEGHPALALIPNIEKGLTFEPPTGLVETS